MALGNCPCCFRGTINLETRCCNRCNVAVPRVHESFEQHFGTIWGRTMIRDHRLDRIERSGSSMLDYANTKADKA